jgi:hypothetical protein
VPPEALPRPPCAVGERLGPWADLGVPLQADDGVMPGPRFLNQVSGLLAPELGRVDEFIARSGTLR